MAHTFDDKVKIPAAANTGVTANPATGTFACGDGATLLTLGLIYAGNSARTGGTPTYGGVTGTQIDTRRGVTECSAELWYWLAPPTGQTLLISIPNAGGVLLEGFVSSYAAQNGYISLLDVSGGTGTTAANPFWRLTTKSPGDAIIGVVADGVNAWGPTSQSGTVIYNEDPSTWGGGAQYILQSASGTVTIEWQAGSDDYGIVTAAFREQDSGNRSKSLTDAAAALDDENITASFSLFDLGSGSDDIVATLLPKYIQDIVLDIFTGTMISVSDTGTGTDRTTISALLSLTEQGLSIETISQLASLIVLERAFGIDSFQLANSLGLTDIAISQDNLSLSALLTSFDFGTALDLIRSVASLQVLEQSLGSDNLSNLTASLSVSDFGFSSDVISILISVLKAVSDSGSGSDQVLNILASLSVNDLSLVTESLLNILASLQISETSVGLDNLSGLIASLSVSDYASGSEAISVLAAFLISVIDSGSGSDRIANLLASLSVSEISSVLEALVEVVSASLIDSGAGIDSSALAASLGLTDTTLAGDFLGLSALDVIAELGRGSDTLPGLLASLGITEGGSAGDLLNLLASLSIGDVGSGSDLVNVLAGVVKAISDAASGLDGVSISASMSMVDNGSGVDNLSLTVSLTVRDTGIGTDSLSVLTQTLKSIFDTVSGIDRLSISASLNIPEPSFGIDSSAIAASLIGYDISITSDSPQIQASLTLTDASSSTDIINILQTAIKLVQDLASGNDFIGTISASIPVSDAVIGADGVAQLLASLLVTDFGTGVEIVISYDVTTQIIKISFIIKKSAIGFAFAHPKIEFGIAAEKKKLIEFEFKCPKIEFSLQTEHMAFSFLDGG